MRQTNVNECQMNCIININNCLINLLVLLNNEK